MPVSPEARILPQPNPEGEQPTHSDEEQRIARLDAFGQSLAQKRSEAIAAREECGIEDIWLEDEEFYEGIDDLNRADERNIWRQKPPGQAAPKTDQDKTRSRVFPNITGPFTDAASARIADMLLPTDDRPWSLKETPIPDLVDIAKGEFPKEFMAQVTQAHPDETQRASAIQQAQAKAKDTVDEAKQRAEKAQKRIEDWHVECQWHAEVRAVIEDASKSGTGVLKGPIPVTKRKAAYIDNAVTLVEKLQPASKRIDYWNFYPDGACGENIHNGSYTWERDYLTKKQVRELIGQEGYIDTQILRCLHEGPQKATGTYRETLDPMNDPEHKGKFEIWYFHGTAEREDLVAAECDCGDSETEDPHMPAMVAMINNRVIKAALNPIDHGEFPYDVMVWRRRVGHWTGTGVGRQIRTPQKIVTGATRALMDNAGLAAGPMIVFRQGVVKPADGVYSIAPRKIWFISEDADEMKDARYAIGSVKVDMLVGELMQIIELGLRLAEHVTGLPMLLQGQMGKAPDTVGGMTMLQNNASSVLRRLARTFDDRVTEPHIRRYYVWLLQYGEDDEKGDFSIDARGSSALVERDLQNQELAQIGHLVLDPRFGKDPKRWMDEYLKSRHFDPKRFDYDDQEWQKIVENLAKKPQDHAIAVAQLRAQTEERLSQAEMQFKAAENQRDRELQTLLKEMDGEIAGLKIEGVNQQVLDKIKSELAKTVMQLRTQKQLASMDAGAKLMAQPPTEPPGRASEGKSYQQ